jgi:threonine/homoserine/homoserine lactone efflux protein
VLSIYLFAWLGVLAAQATPGPNMMAVTSTALADGRRAALMVVAGIVSGVLAWTVLVAVGLGALFHQLPVLLTILKFVGGAYLLYLGARGIVAAIRGGGSPGISPRRAGVSATAAWRRGLFVVMLNPKAALMWSAVATFLFGAGLGAAEVLAFGPVAALSAGLIYGLYGIAFSSGIAVAAYLRFSRWIEGLFGAVFGALGGTLLAAGASDLRG